MNTRKSSIVGTLLIAAEFDRAIDIADLYDVDVWTGMRAAAARDQAVMIARPLPTDLIGYR